MIKSFVFIAAIWLSLAAKDLVAQPTTTHVHDVLYDGGSHVVVGSCTYWSASRFTAPGGYQVVGENVQVNIVNGVIDFFIIPTDTATPSPQFYNVRCRGQGGWTQVGAWMVPTTGSILPLGGIWASNPSPPGITIPLSQLGTVGASGTSVCSNGTSWIAGSGCTTAGGSNADWNANSGPTQILNRPTLGAAALLNMGTLHTTAAYGDHLHTGVYEPVDTTILRQSNFAGTGVAITPARSDHNHNATYQPILGFTPEDAANRGGANGYAPLNSNSRVPMVNLASGTPDGTKFVRDDGVLSVPPGGGGGFSGTPNLVLATDPLGSSTSPAALRSLVANDIPVIPVSKVSGGEASSNKSTNTALGNSDTAYPTQRAVKTYVDAGFSTGFPTVVQAPGDGVTDASIAIQTSIDAACAHGGGRAIWFPGPVSSYLVGTSLTVCDQLDIGGAFGSVIVWTGSGGLFNIGADLRVNIHGLNIGCNATAGQWAIRVVGSGGLGLEVGIISDNVIDNCGDVATLSGGGISIEADSSTSKIVDNVIGTNGTGISITAATDTIEVTHNIMSSATGRCIDVNGGSGAGTMGFYHNNITCRGGGIRFNPTAGLGIIKDNEFELPTAYTSVDNTNHSPYEILNGQVEFVGNLSNSHGHGTYDFYVADSATNSIFSMNTPGSVTATNFRNGSGFGNIYKRDNRSSTYSNPNYTGIEPPIFPPVVIATTCPPTDPGGQKVYLFNNTTNCTFNVPDGVAGMERVYRNETGTTGIITLSMFSANVVDLAGIGSTVTNAVTSGGALGDEVKLVCDFSHHWHATGTHGTWTVH